MVTLDQIRRAGELKGPGRFRETPLHFAPALDQRLAAPARVHLKLELFQRTGSFKVRGATAKMHSLTRTEMARGVITASAGNHAQGVALAAKSFGVRARVVMPECAPLTKREATASYGAEIVLHGRDYDEAFERAREIQAADGATFVHAFDDETVIAGQGTVGLEILEQLPDVATVVCPVGGGGLIAGVAVAVKSVKPNVRIVGVQAAGADAAVRAFREGRRVACGPAETIADGIRVRNVGALPLEAILTRVDAMVAVDDSAICRALLVLDEHAHLSVEPAGAVAVAALLDGRLDDDVRGDGPVVAVVSGGNMDPFERMRCMNRALVAERRQARLRLRMNGCRRGADPRRMAEVFRVLADHDADVVEVAAHGGGHEAPSGGAVVEILVNTRGAFETDAVSASLAQAGFPVT